MFPCLLFSVVPASVYVAPRCHTGCGLKWFGGGRDEVLLPNVSPQKEYLLWLRVSDWSCAVLFIHLCTPVTAAAVTSSSLLLSLVPLPLGSQLCWGAGSPPMVTAATGSAGEEKKANAPSSLWVLERGGRWLKADIPCCFILWVCVCVCSARITHS